jgi:hypothetical protein
MLQKLLVEVLDVTLRIFRQTIVHLLIEPIAQIVVHLKNSLAAAFYIFFKILALGRILLIRRLAIWIHPGTLESLFKGNVLCRLLLLRFS